MLTNQWFDDADARFTSCVEAVAGLYPLERTVLLSNTPYTRQQRVFMRLLFLCRVPSETIRKLTGWDKWRVQFGLQFAAEEGVAREADKRLVSILLQHITTSVDADPDLPPESWRHDDRLRQLQRLHCKRRQPLLTTRHGDQWDLRYGKKCDHIRSMFNVVNAKKAGEELDERWPENRANDPRIWECFRYWSLPCKWNGRIVLLVRGYAFALRLSGQDLETFEADGRVVFLSGKSRNCKGRWNERSQHCLVFLVADDARSFVESVTEPKPLRRLASTEARSLCHPSL